MTELETKIAALEALRATFGDSWVDQQLAALLSAAPPVQLRIEAGEGSSASGNRQTVVLPGATYYETPPDPRLPLEERALIAYLRRTRGESNALALAALDATDAEQRPIELSRVYIGLNVVSRVLADPAEQVARGGAGSNTRPQTAVEAVLNSSGRRLTLLGAPGSGKSTFLNHLALCLAGAALAERRTGDPQPADGWLARIPAWTLGALLPVKIILRDFAAFVSAAGPTRGSARLLREFLAQMLAQAGCAEALEPLVAALADGQAILLLDGLDEVVGDQVLALVGESITDALRLYPRSPAVITCRVLDFQASRLRQLPDFADDQLADLSDEQVQQFVEDWYAELAASGRRTDAQAQDDARALQAAIQARVELQSLARTPLLLTVMALVHTSRGALPDARALLYAECVDLLLLRWRRRRDEPDLLTQLGLSQFRATDLLGLMARLGFAAHEASARQTDTAARPADLSRLEVIGLFAEGFSALAPDRAFMLAEQLLHTLERGNGLLLKRGPDQYAFPHRTFQEFLAGYHLLSTGQYLRRCKERAPQAHWHEALLLMAGYQTLAGGDPEKPLVLARELLGRSLAERVLAGEILNLVGRAAAAANDPEHVMSGGLWDQACDALLSISTSSGLPDAPAPLRARAGNALGMLCYGSLDKIVATDAAPRPDLRLPLAVVGLSAQRELWWPVALEAYWLPIERGKFWFGDDRREPLRQLTIATDYRIAQYTITNAEFRLFVDAGGYDPTRGWWTEQGRAWLQDTQQRAPMYWRDARYNAPTQPVVGITWYEASAYCAWLTTVGHRQGWLPKDSLLRLPTWIEWQRAARGTGKRRYPWGGHKPSGERANYNATGIARAAPIGCFPSGIAPSGAHDMAGNVMEWTCTAYATCDSPAVRTDFAAVTAVVLSVSDCLDSEPQLSCGAIEWAFPGYWVDNRSVRVVWASAADPLRV